MSAPEVSVVVPSHGRLLRLRWLLNALDEQTLDAARFEVIVVHTYRPEEADPLGRGRRYGLRLLAVGPGEAGPARQRNRGWRAARAPLVAFTDDDCRPDPRWLAELLSAAADDPGAVVQGATLPEPADGDVWAAPHVRTVTEPRPPGLHVQTANVLYPTAVLVALGGFDEAFPAPAGEDTDLALRARATRTEIVGAPAARVFHAVEEHSLPAMIRLNWKWRHIPLLARRHPGVRAGWDLGVFWRRRHRDLVLALAGALGARRWAPVGLLALPYGRRLLTRRRRSPAGTVLALAELPGQVVVDLAEVGTLLAGSVRYRALVV